MKKLFLALLVLVATGASAQNGVTNEFRFGQGEDSIRCLENISIVNNNIKDPSVYDEVVYPRWKELFNEFPVARVDTYTNGITILNTYIKKESDPAKKADYIKELMAIYDQQAKYVDQLQEVTKSKLSAGNIMGKKAMEYLKHIPGASIDTLYSLFSHAVNLEKGESEYSVTQNFMKYSALKYKQDKSHGNQIIEDYVNASQYIVDVLDKYNERIEHYNNKYKESGEEKDSINAYKYGKMIDASRIAKSNIDAFFINSGAASCEDLSNIYSPQLEANKDNIEFLNKLINVMSMLKCTEEEIYLTASEYALAIEPNAKAAMGCGYRYYKRGDLNKALEYFDMAIEYETSATKKAELCYSVAAIYFKRGNYTKTRQYANKALSHNSKYGDPHILIAQCYANGPKWSNDPFENACVYYLCLDRLDRAKAVDPSCKREADRFTKAYEDNLPSGNEIFMRGYTKGKVINIGGWINETTKVR